MPIRVPLEVCSECQLDCAHCAHKGMRAYNPNYHLSMKDLESFLNITEKSNYTVDLFLHGPGEPLLWRHIKEGIALMRKSKAVNDIVITTNGIALQNAIDVMDDITRIDVSYYPSVAVKELKHSKVNYVIKTHFANKQFPARIPCNCICPGPMIYGNMVFPVCGPCVFDAVKRIDKDKDPLTLAVKLSENYFNSEEMFGKIPECEYCWANLNSEVIAEEHRLLDKHNRYKITTTSQEGVMDKRQRRLHIGGQEKNSEWEILDILPSPIVDHIAEASDLSDFGEGEFVEVYASHVLEHLDFAEEVLTALAEWYRVLEPGGRLMVSVPDLDCLAELLLIPDLTVGQWQFLTQIIFGGHSNPFDYHNSGYNERYLEQLLRLTGFENICRVETFNVFKDASNMVINGRYISLNMVATKPVNSI